MPHVISMEELAKQAYVVKILRREGGSDIYEIYNRQYVYLEMFEKTLYEKLRDELLKLGKVVVQTDDWNGGRTREMAYTLWYDFTE